MKRGIFSLWLRHHTSVNDIRADGHPFFTLYPTKLFPLRFRLVVIPLHLNLTFVKNMIFNCISFLTKRPITKCTLCFLWMV